MPSTVNIQSILEHQASLSDATTKDRPRDRRFFPFGAQKVSEREKAEFSAQLAVMLLARVSLQQSLAALKQQARTGRMKQVIEKLLSEIQKGNSFGKALARQPEVFDALFVVTAEVGEETGRLAEVLSHLAHYLEKIYALKRKFYQALTYPALIVAVACFAVIFLLVFIIPSFAEMFKSFQLELPWSTIVVMGVSAFVVEYGMWVLLPSIVLALLLYNLARAQSFAPFISKLALRVPFLGDVLLKNHIARFCRTLGTLLHAQVTLVEALELTGRNIGHIHLQEEIHLMLKHIKQGRAMAEPFIGSKLFPPMVAQMIAVGEQTSELDTMLLKVAEFYEKELDSKIETLSTLIEPVIIIFLGLIVAAILVSMYLPMFDLVNVVGGG